jgi:hypothetical protein
MTKNSALWLVPGLLLAIGCQSAAAGQRYGKEPESKTPKVTLAELIAKPDAYEGKDVVVDGQFGGTCEDGDFYFKDKLEIIEADPPTPEVNSLKKGTAIRLFGLVKVRRGSGDPSVKIVGKGVEVLK